MGPERRQVAYAQTDVGWNADHGDRRKVWLSTTRGGGSRPIRSFDLGDGQAGQRSSLTVNGKDGGIAVVRRCFERAGLINLNVGAAADIDLQGSVAETASDAGERAASVEIHLKPAGSGCGSGWSIPALGYRRAKLARPSVEVERLGEGAAQLRIDGRNGRLGADDSRLRWNAAPAQDAIALEAINTIKSVTQFHFDARLSAVQR